MTDSQMEMVKKFFSTFDSLDEFIEKYINVNKPSNAEALIEFFKDTRTEFDVWEYIKCQRSIETLRLDKLIPEKATIEDIINLSQEYDLSKYKRIMIKLDNKDYDDIDKLSSLGIDIFIRVAGDKGMCTLDEFKEMREFFDEFINRYSTYNLSPIEKITLAYDSVKFFSYNETDSDKTLDSTSIAKSISTGNIVCEGYSRIFCQLLSEMGITSNIIYSEPTENRAGHTRVIISVNDEKYGINSVFAFDPTWDANQDMSFIKHPDGSTEYEIGSWLKEGDTVLKRLPSSIRYLFFMVPINEYKKYFPNEKIEKIQKYPSGELIELSEKVMTIINNNDHKPRNRFIYGFIHKLLHKVKKVEGYLDEEIEEYVHHAVEIINQDRYGRFDNYRIKKDSIKMEETNMDIVYHNETTSTSESVVDITEVPKEAIPSVIKEFAEGSPSLEKCLQSIYDAGVATRACCKGNHIEVIGDDLDPIVEINSESYIAFEEDDDWTAYLSPQIIEDEFVVIEGNCIRYYGEYRDEFLEKLSEDFRTGKKENKDLIEKKKNTYSREKEDELSRQSFIFTLKKNGFSDEQSSTLLSLKLEIDKPLYDETLSDMEAIRQNNEIIHEYHAEVKKFFKENLQKSTKKR